MFYKSLEDSLELVTYVLFMLVHSFIATWPKVSVSTWWGLTV